MELEQEEWELLLRLVEEHWDTKDDPRDLQDTTEDDRFLGGIIRKIKKEMV